MPRKVPGSHKQKKIKLINQRATKRGEEAPIHVPERGPAPWLKPSARPDAHRAGPGGKLALQSRFISMPPQYVEKTRDLAFSERVARPLPGSAACLPLELVINPAGDNLTVPVRPRFRYGQTKKEVERNEEGIFRKWLASTRETVEDWVSVETGPDEWPHSPSWFETNLEVWCQLWRVVETSSIVLLLVDSRCPPVHCPPSLRTYLRNTKRQVILVLTKSDLVDPVALAGWRTWLRRYWAGDEDDEQGDDNHDVEIVAVSSYDTALLYSSEGRARHRPNIPTSARSSLIAAIKRAHARLMAPPSWAASDPEKLAAWKPTVRSKVNWSALASDPDPTAGRPVKTARTKPNYEKEESESASESEDDGGPYVRDPETEPLTIGLVGQPNVGKSSLLNALLGYNKVRASKTPGKTKHFQTILWGDAKDVKIVDCPGLVCPSLVPMELQAMAGILPVSQIPSLPSCMHFAASHLPLEDVFHIPPPEIEVDTMASKRTWRTPREEDPDVIAAAQQVPWTAGLIMEERALDRGFVTAKSGRPDTNRAGNGMLRALADGRVRWGFYPPGGWTEREGVGAWLGGRPDIDGEPDDEDGLDGEMLSDLDSDGDENKRHGAEEDEEEEEEESEESEDEFQAANKHSFFAALSLDDGDDDDDDEEEEEEEGEETV